MKLNWIKHRAKWFLLVIHFLKTINNETVENSVTSLNVVWIRHRNDSFDFEMLEII